MTHKVQLIPTLIALSMMIALSPILAQGVGASISKTLPPVRKALVNALSTTTAIKKLSKEWHNQMIIFTDIDDHVIGSWAWIQATPQTGDGKQHFDPVSGVMHRVSGRWKLVEWVGDEVAHADDSQAAFTKWRKNFVKNHPGCPAKIFPSKF